MTDTPTPFPVPEQHLDECVILTLPDEIDLANAPGIGDQMLKLLDFGTRGVIADMSRTRFCDAAGVDAVMRAHDHAEELGAWVRAVISHPHVRKVFTITQVDQQVQIHTTLGDAFQETPEGTDGASVTDA